MSRLRLLHISKAGSPTTPLEHPFQTQPTSVGCSTLTFDQVLGAFPLGPQTSREISEFGLTTLGSPTLSFVCFEHLLFPVVSLVNLSWLGFLAFPFFSNSGGLVQAVWRAGLEPLHFRYHPAPGEY